MKRAIGSAPRRKEDGCAPAACPASLSKKVFITCSPCGAEMPGQKEGSRIMWLNTCWSEVSLKKRVPRAGWATFACHARAKAFPCALARMKRMPVLKVPPAE